MDLEILELSDDLLSEVNGGTNWNVVQDFMKKHYDELPPAFQQEFNAQDLGNSANAMKLRTWIWTKLSSTPSTEPVWSLLRDAIAYGS